MSTDRQAMRDYTYGILREYHELLKDRSQGKTYDETYLSALEMQLGSMIAAGNLPEEMIEFEHVEF